MVDERVYPRGLRRCWSTDSETWAYRFDRKRGVVVQFPVGRLFWLSRPKIKVRLIPDFKIPLCDFIDTVAVDQVLHERRDQAVPVIPIPGWRNIRFIPKCVQDVLGCQLVRHEADLHKWAHTVRQQTIVDLVYIREVIYRVSLTVLIVEANLVMKNGVEPHVLEVGDRFDRT